MTRVLLGGTDNQKRKPTTKERVCGVCDLDLGQGLFLWVVEGGIKLGSRLTVSTTANCSRSFAGPSRMNA